MRLVGGRDDSVGRLEVCRHGMYGTICNTTWTMENTRVVCNQLGFSDQGREVGCSCSVITAAVDVSIGVWAVLDGGRAGPIVLDAVNCTGNETDILSCSSNDNASTCSTSMHVELNCSPTHVGSQAYPG